MHTKFFLITVFILFPINLSAYLTTDSLTLYTLSPIKTPNLSYNLTQETGISSIVNSHITSIYSNQRNPSAHSSLFIENIRNAAQRSYVTRKLLELMVKEPEMIRLTEIQAQRSESQFVAHKGKIIREISFRTTDVFAPRIDAPRHYSPGKLKNIGMLLNFTTKEKIIQNNLLFKPGDNIDPFLLADNERILRQLSYIEDARIYVYQDDLNQEYADIVVVTKDRWSWGFDMDMSEIDEGNIEFYNKNVFGLGQEFHANLLFDGSENRIFGYQNGIKINNIAGTFINTGMNYSDAFDNKLLHIQISRNFITPSIKYAGGFKFTSSDMVDNFNFPDTSFMNQKLAFHEYDYWFGRSFLINKESDDMHTRRNFYITSRFNRNIFFERPDITETSRYVFHNKNLFLLSLSYTKLGYLKSSYIYGFGPTEDIPVGSKVETNIGYENNQFFPRLYAGFSFTHSRYMERLAYLKNKISMGGFINDGVREQGVLKLESSGFSRLMNLESFFLRQFFSVNFTRGIERFDDELISISNRNGVRGLTSEQLKGSQKLILQMETMLYAKKNWHGFKYAFYSMADLGWIGSGNNFVLKEDFYSGFGLGIRLRNEHLVFPTLQLRLAWFPRIPESASAKLFYIMSERSQIFNEFNVTSPDILPYR